MSEETKVEVVTDAKAAPARKTRGKGKTVAEVTVEEAEALTEQVLATAGYGLSEQAYEWDSEPCAYIAPGTRPQIVVLPAGRVNATQLAFRQSMREKFATLNRKAKEDAKVQYEADIKALALSERGEERYREGNPFWTIPAPAPLGIVADSRDVRGSGQVAPLPAGFERRAPAA